jgi:gliding motility-associated-like protein
VITEKDENIKIVFTEPSTGCKDSINQLVNIQVIPKAIIASDKDAEKVFCHPFNVTFNNSKCIAPIGTITTWQLTPSVSITRDDASYSYPKGNHSVKLSLVTPNNCKHDTIFPFKVIGPEGKITASPLSICKGESIKFGIKDTSDITSFTWDFADGKTQVGGAPVNHTYYTLEPKLKVQLKMSGNGCEFIDTVSIAIKQVVANFDRIELNPTGVDTVICIGDAMKFTNTSTNANIFKWELGENETSILKDIASKTYSKADTINIRLYASSSTLNCKDTITKQIIVSTPPKVTVIPDTICVKNSITLKTVEDLTSFVSYTWNSTDLFPKQTTNYSITVKDKENCTGTSTAQIIVIQEPDDTPFTDTIIIGDQVTLPVDNNFGANIFTWTPPTKLSCLDCANPIAGPLLADTIYSLLIEDVKNCFQKTKTFTIIVKPITHIKLPTTFTPNSDGNNDIVFVRGWGIKKLISFEIYNRWGELMYKGTDINEGWNGYYKDELQNNDVYAYKVIALSWLNDTEMVKEGYIHLMR